MNIKPLIDNKLKEFAKNFPDYTYTEIFFSALNIKFKGRDFEKKELLGLTDKEFYELLCNAHDRERKIDLKTNKDDGDTRDNNAGADGPES